MKRASGVWVAAGFAFVLLAAACERTHLSPHFGEATRQALKTQVIDKNAGAVAKPDQPLDPEESAIISRTYLRSLAPANAPQETTARGGLLVAPPASAGLALPTPTVPR